MIVIARRFLIAMTTLSTLLIVVSGCMWLPPAAVTRADLGTSLQRFEQAYRKHPPTGEKVAEVNRAFDQATLAFFLGNFGEVIKGIEAAAEMLRASAPTDAQRVAASLKLRLTPSAGRAGNATPPTLRLTSMYEVALSEDQEIELRLRVLDHAGLIVHEQPLRVIGSASTRIDLTANLELDPAKLTAQDYRLELIADRESFFLLRWPVTTETLTRLRAVNTTRLEKLSASTPALEQAMASTRARNALLLDPPAEDRVIEFITERSALATSVANEVERLEAEENPFLLRKGNYWRVFKRAGDEVPLRIYCPESLDLSKPVPLVVAFHGYGGDENLFPDGYGAGTILKLAEQHGFLLVCPLTYPFMNSPAVLDRLLEVIGYDYPIDLARVYLMGHSLGAACAASIAPRRADRIAGMCLFAGGGNLPDADTLPPTIVFLGGLDLVSPPSRSRPAVQRAIEKGLPVTLREKPDLGHTILVGESLGEGTAFLMEQRLDSARRK